MDLSDQSEDADLDWKLFKQFDVEDEKDAAEDAVGDGENSNKSKWI